MKSLKYILFTLTVSFIFIGNVFAASGDLNTNFCTGTVQGIFTSLGWLFYFTKIITPIVLIAVGCFDFAKAITAGAPDDQLKKAFSGLVKKAVAGIVIFFVPALLSLIVDLVNGNDVYKGGTFSACTKCMLDPKSGCSSLGGN